MNGSILIFVVLTISAFALVSAQRTLGNDAFYIMNSYLPPGDFCGPDKIITGWNVIREVFQTASTPLNMNNNKPKNFDPATGIFTAPLQGYYHICGSARIKKGSHGDFTIVKAANSQAIQSTTDIQGAFGSVCPVNCDWSTHQQCIVIRLGMGSSVAIRLNSGSSSDCAQTTEWRYGKFDIFLIAEET